MATKENQSIAGYQAHIGRLTRSRSAALRAALPPVPSVQVKKSKKIPSDENAQIETKSKKLSSDKNAKICISSNLGVSKGKLKKLGSDENTNIDISSNLGVSKGKSEKSDSNENSLIWVSKGKNKIGVSSNVGSDENTQIGVQKGKTKRAALTEITNNGGVSLKLTRPCSGLSEITNNGGASLKLMRPNSALSEITNNGGVSLKLIKPDDLIKLKGKRPALGECTNNETGTKLGNPNKRQKLMKAANDVLCDGVFKRSFPVPKVQTKVFSGAKMGICKVNQENKTGPNAILTSSSLSHINILVKDNRSGPKELYPPVENLEQDKDNECGVLFLEESTALMRNNNLKEGDTTSSSVVNIDGDKSNTLLCTIYAPDLYSNLRATELIRRPSFNFLETLQNDVTQSMRAILVDWLVEVCDEYRLVPDTLYLTVYLIDRFLSLSYIERQRLQLLGITCMLIASKYEEICAPRVEEFCFITDNTYNRNQVLEMEYQVLSQLGYHISMPTAKTFLRRFLRAAQASTKAPPTLMHLTNYLAELTLVEYNFTKYLPSQIAASAVFLARWTLDQSDHPWNETLEHYTCYKSSDLKASILSLQELQINTQNCPLKAIRDKYKNEKFESVANLKSPELIGSLFC